MFKHALPTLLMLCLLGSIAQAQKFSTDFEWYNSAHGRQKNSQSLIDPTGQRLDSPDDFFETDLRINSKYTWRKGTRFIFRPRFVGDTNKHTGKASLPEAYLEGDLTKRWTLAAGLQNYQWGPAEFISPTNPFFHFNPSQRAYNFKEDGRLLLRANWTPSELWSIVTIAEPENNGTSFWIYERKFKPKGLLKIERRGENALNYFGVTAGTIDDEIPFIGQYFNFELLQGFSFYLDARQSKGSAQYIPALAPDTLYDMTYVKDTMEYENLVVTGFRWEGSVDFRIEYIFNSYGFTKDDMQAAFQSALPQHPRGDQNLKRLLGSGMELFGKHYAYTSLRIPDLFTQNNNLAFRYVRSLMDQSANLQIAWDTAIGDAFTIFADGSFSIGDNTQELSALEKSSGSLGIKWNF